VTGHPLAGLNVAAQVRAGTATTVRSASVVSSATGVSRSFAGADGAIASPPAGETLGLFEGSGIETSWVPELPKAANPYGFADLADVLFTIDGRAQYSQDLHDSQQAGAPSTVRRAVVVSAGAQSPDAVAQILDDAIPTVSIDFDLASIGLSSAESNRIVTNLFIVLAAPGTASGPIEIKAATEATPVTVTLGNGIALSNAGELANAHPAEQLNALVGVSATQTFTVGLSKAQLTGVDFTRTRDLVLGVEYEATLEP
jgi:hypothetical protein